MTHPEVSQEPKVEVMSSLYAACGLFHQRLCACPPIPPKGSVATSSQATSHKPQYAAIVILVMPLQVDHRTSCFPPTREELWFNKQNTSPLLFSPKFLFY